jgi:hypothetical protein
MKNNQTTVEMWSEISESQSETINGGYAYGGYALISIYTKKENKQTNNAYIYNSNTAAFGLVNYAGGVSLNQGNWASL